MEPMMGLHMTSCLYYTVVLAMMQQTSHNSKGLCWVELCLVPRRYQMPRAVCAGVSKACAATEDRNGHLSQCMGDTHDCMTSAL